LLHLVQQPVFDGDIDLIQQVNGHLLNQDDETTFFDYPDQFGKEVFRVGGMMQGSQGDGPVEGIIGSIYLAGAAQFEFQSFILQDIIGQVLIPDNIQACDPQVRLMDEELPGGVHIAAAKVEQVRAVGDKRRQ